MSCKPSTPSLNDLVGDQNTVQQRALDVLNCLEALPTTQVHFYAYKNNFAQCESQVRYPIGEVVKTNSPDELPRKIEQITERVNLEKAVSEGEVRILPQPFFIEHCTDPKSGTEREDVQAIDVVADFEGGNSVSFTVCPDYVELFQGRFGRGENSLYLSGTVNDYHFKGDPIRGLAPKESYGDRLYYGSPITGIHEQLSSQVQSTINQAQEIAVTCVFPGAGISESRTLKIGKDGKGRR